MYGWSSSLRSRADNEQRLVRCAVPCLIAAANVLKGSELHVEILEQRKQIPASVHYTKIADPRAMITMSTARTKPALKFQ